MNTPNYSNKAEPQTLVRHKACKHIVTHVGMRLWCEQCQDYVDASQCYHDAQPAQDVKA
jgi:hypothetical protein